MATEIERKFLVCGTTWRTAAGVRISQGYLNRDKLRTVRVRVAGSHAFLTVKGITTGVTRAEFEYPVPVGDAEQMLAMCEGPVITKIRHLVPYDGTRWEVDEFGGENAGLVVAEVELTDADQPFSIPPWLGAEVTHDPRYYNANLATHPYSAWANGA